MDSAGVAVLWRCTGTRGDFLNFHTHEDEMKTMRVEAVKGTVAWLVSPPREMNEAKVESLPRFLLPSGWQLYGGQPFRSKTNRVLETAGPPR
jgi:hypothetical protein